MKLCIDPGHGGEDPGAAGGCSFEKDINLKLSMKLGELLLKNKVEILFTRMDDRAIDLRKRCSIANKNNCDYFISVHCSSCRDPLTSGSITCYFNESKKSMELASTIQYAAGYGKSREGYIKPADFYVLRHTVMPAVVFKAGFITNPGEEALLLDGHWQQEFVKRIGEALCRLFGIETIEDGLVYSIVHDDVKIGEYTSKWNTLKLAEELLAESNSGNIRVESSDGKVILDRTKIPQMDGGGDDNKHSIIDYKKATSGQMETFVHRINPYAPYIAKKYIDIGMEEGVRGDIAYAQAVKETNYFRYTDDTKPSWGKMEGLFIGTENDIRAHMKLLKCFAGGCAGNSGAIYNMEHWGTAPNFEDLDGKWEFSRDGYGQSIINIWRQMLNEPHG